MFEKQFFVENPETRKKFIFDFCIPDLKLLVEADGDYWHANPALYKDVHALTSAQIKNVNNDTEKTRLANQLGYTVIRFWETDIKNNNFVQCLKEEIAKWEKK